MDYGSLVDGFAQGKYYLQMNFFLLLETGQHWEGQQFSDVSKHEHVMSTTL